MIKSQNLVIVLPKMKQTKKAANLCLKDIFGHMVSLPTFLSMAFSEALPMSEPPPIEFCDSKSSILFYKNYIDFARKSI